LNSDQNILIDHALLTTRFSYRFIKRLLDVVLSLLLTIFFSPFFIIISITLLFSSGWPILYQWNVVGKNGVPFKSWKFRTMVTDADKINI